MRYPARVLKIGDFITNVGDVNPTFIGKVLSISSRKQYKEICVKVVKRPTGIGQANMPDEWVQHYGIAINVFRKLTDAEKLLYTLE